MRLVYVTRLTRTGYRCDCPGAFNQDDGAPTAREAARDAVHHVRYYGDTWPHKLAREKE